MTETTADLHIHTTCSDGSKSPAELPPAAAGLGLAAIAITDHDNTDGVIEARKAGKGTGVEVIAGVELSCRSMNADKPDEELHLLGYYLDLENATLRDALRRLRDIRAARAERVLEKLRELGIDLNAGKIHALTKGKSVGRPHIARALVESGHADSIEDAFLKYLRRGRPAFVARPLLTVREAIELVKTAGGAPVVAHPLFGGPRRPKDWDLLVEWGVMGIEAHHPDHAPHHVKAYVKLARERGLVVTGGSDFHGDYERSILGACRVSLGVLSELKKRL